MLIDSHCHINFNTYKEDADEVIRRSLDKDIWLINIGAQHSTSKRSIKIAEKYEKGVYAVVGLHPIHLNQDITERATFHGQEYKFTTKREQFSFNKYKELALSSDKVVGLGETGLDYYYYFNQLEMPIEQAKKIQKDVFEDFLKLAQELDLPVVLHCRGSKEDNYGAYEEMLEILNQQSNKAKKQQSKGVIHCYGGNLTQAKRFLELGFHIGFTGVITFKKADELREVVKEVPLEKILVETDAPFLAPEPYRGKRNEPAYVECVAKKIAEIKGVSFKEVAEQTFNNTRELFNF